MDSGIVRDAVENLLAQMRAHAVTLDDIRETVEIAAIVRQIALPTLSDDTPPSFVPAIARATLLGAWVKHDADKHRALRAA